MISKWVKGDHSRSRRGTNVLEHVSSSWTRAVPATSVRTYVWSRCPGSRETRGGEQGGPGKGGQSGPVLVPRSSRDCPPSDGATEMGGRPAAPRTVPGPPLRGGWAPRKWGGGGRRPLDPCRPPGELRLLRIAAAAYRTRTRRSRRPLVDGYRR